MKTKWNQVKRHLQGVFMQQLLESLSQCMSLKNGDTGNTKQALNFRTYWVSVLRVFIYLGSGMCVCVCARVLGGGVVLRLNSAVLWKTTNITTLLWKVCHSEEWPAQASWTSPSNPLSGFLCDLRMLHPTEISGKYSWNIQTYMQIKTPGKHLPFQLFIAM